MPKKGIFVARWEHAFDSVLSPFEEFIHRQTTSGVLLMICAVIALVIANSQWNEAYLHLLHTKINLSFGEHTFSLSVHHWINEALMVAFFFIMGLELKRELLVGELASPQQALLPILAAVGGMLVPAGVYMLFNTSGHTSIGWGIPMATDIAFAVGILSLLGSRIPKNLIIFLVALAIVDDLGAVVVIALFYTNEINLFALTMAGVCTVILIFFNLGGIRWVLPYVLVGILLWVAMLTSGIHATVAGIILAFTIPIRPKFDPQKLIQHVRDLTEKMSASYRDGPDIIRNALFRSQVTMLGDGVDAAQAPAQQLEHKLHLPVAYLVIPIFALANAGIPIDVSDLSNAMTHPVTLGVFFGLFLGKLIGIAGFTWIALLAGWSTLPEGLRMSHVIGVALLGGIGFTMSIFIADLGFVDYPADLLMAKSGIIMASLVSGIAGTIWLLKVTDKPEQD